METVKEVENYFNKDIMSLLNTPVIVNFPGEDKPVNVIFLGIEIDEREFFYCCVRRINSFIVEGVHPSRIKFP